MAWNSDRKLLSQANVWPLEQTFGGKITCSLWNHMSVPLQQGKAPAVSYPDWVQIRDNGSGSIGIYGYSFGDGEYLWASRIFPHDYKNGTTIYPRIYFICMADVDPADNFKIGLEYCWGQEGSFPANSSILETTISTGVNSSGVFQEIDLGTGAGISGVGHEFGELFTCRLYRAAAAADNYAGEVVITDLVINHEIDCFGTIAKSTK